MTRSKKIVLPLTALVLGALIGFGVAEVSVRILLPQRTGPALAAYDPELGSRLVPNLRGRITLPGLYSFEFAHNSLGMRATGIVDNKHARSRILILGDSFAYGWGVNDKETFAYLLEERLSRTPLSATVMNAGNGGKGTDYELRFFDIVGRKLKPDLTVLCFFSNDYLDNERSLIYNVGPDGTLRLKPTLGAIHARKEFFRRSRVYNWLISWSHAANLLKYYSVIYLKQQESLTGGDAAANGPDTWSTKVFLEYLVREVRNVGSELIIFYIPAYADVERYRQSREISRDEAVLIELLGPNQHGLVSLTATFADSGKPLSALYFRRDVPNHWTPMSHSLAAAFMEPFVKERLERHLRAK